MLAVGCQHLPPGGGVPAASGPARQADTIPREPSPAPLVREAEAPVEDLWERMRGELSWQDNHRPEVASARAYYLGQPEYLSVVSARASRYLYYIVEEVEARDLPMELALLPLVESTLDPLARSPEHAAGLWQIMPATGRYLGLRQDWWYDGRLDLRDSTRVALDYLEELHRQFDGDWMLALAAYNSGKGRVAAARRANTRAGKPTDYWSLKLPRETRHYLPRLIALSQIITWPEAYGVEMPPVANAPAFTVVSTGGQIELARAAALAGVEAQTLRALNPGQLRWATSPDAAQELLLPPSAAEAFSGGIANLSAEDRVRWEHYRIRRGDTLIGIARKFDTEVGLLRQANGIRGSSIRAGDTLMIPYGSEWASSLAMEAPGERIRRGYRVRRGDSLYRIAGRFKVSVDEIVSWNGLDPDKYLQPGQRLTLYVEGG